MLSKTNRLTRKEFDLYLKGGKKYHFPHCSISHTPHSESFHGAVVVGKKVAKRAVERNKLRRRIYALLYRLVKVEQKAGVYIVMIKPSFASLPRKVAAQEITNAIAELHKKT